MYRKCIRIVKNIYQIGLGNTFNVFNYRWKQHYFNTKWAGRALKYNASCSWMDLQKKYSMPSFEIYWNRLQRKSWVPLANFIPIPPDFIIKADEYCKKQFSILGSEKKTYEKIHWHSDLRLGTSEECGFLLHYYRNIPITAGKDWNLSKDIKVPWELSRFQFLSYLGMAYQKTGNQRYARAFVEYVESWLDNNPMLLGPNWVCPMEVALRLLNWVVAFHYFYQSSEISLDFWQRFVCSLHDHIFYLENNWEFYDSRTSNHYLSNLLGYFYGCYFFFGNPSFDTKLFWTYRQLLDENQKQIFSEGTSYEGSVPYHKLVTEMFYYFYILAKEFGLYLPESFSDSLKSMMQFIDWASPAKNILTQIGDNDSGLVVTGLSAQTLQDFIEPIQEGMVHYDKFGLSCIKSKRWHVTLRSHAYHHKQPTGHFHNDVASITLGLDGREIFVDPGSYVYTASSKWRNYFRSVKVHNTFFIDNKEPTVLDERLFYKEMPCKFSNSLMVKNKAGYSLQTSHDLYGKLGVQIQRLIFVSHEDQKIIITDTCQKTFKKADNLEICWNFTLHPLVNPVVLNDEVFLNTEDKALVFFKSELPVEIIDGWYSPEYGVKVPCKRLLLRSVFNSEIENYSFSLTPYK